MLQELKRTEWNTEEFEQRDRGGLSKSQPKDAQRDRSGLSKTQRDIEDVCDSIKNLLLEKNKAYGDSALSPVRVFSRADSVEQIKVRIDDKLSRVSRGHALSDETLDQTVDDLIGYLVLLKIANSRGGE